MDRIQMDRPQTPPPASSRPYGKRLTRDQCLEVKTLFRAGFSHRRIAQQLGVTCRQGRQPALASSQVDEIEKFICSSAENRRMSYFEIAHRVFPHLGVSEDVIRSEMKKRGYVRPAVRSAKPPPST
ncbi:hypothetical protein K3495_g9086 [Podosphaera aphanis]|nr:hypothetical protein K3495_g9086 [Podosphaera aphanis]